MENLELNELSKEATVDGNGQERETWLRHLILDKCKNVDAYASFTDSIISSFVEQIQDIDSSYTKEEIKEAIDKIYHNEYNKMFYDDFLKCLSYKNATIDDYETVRYKYDMFEEMANIYAYYEIANRQGLIKNPVITDLVYDAYTSTASAVGKLVEEEIEDKVYNALERYIDDEDLLEELVEKLLEKMNITYEGAPSIEGLEYEPYGNNKHKGSLLTEILVKYSFDPNTIKEIDQILQDKDGTTLKEVMRSIERFGYDDYWKGDEDWSYQENPRTNEYSIEQLQGIPLDFVFDYENLIEHNKNNSKEKTGDITPLQP